MNISKGGRRRVTRTAGMPTDRTGTDDLRRELNAWLDARTVWNHDEWLGLLADMRMKGFSDLIDTPRGQDAIGLYLENNRKYPSC